MSQSGNIKYDQVLPYWGRGSKDKSNTGTKFSKSTILEMCTELDIPVNEFRSRRLTVRYPFVITDAIYVKVRENHQVISKAVMVAIGIFPNSKSAIRLIGAVLLDDHNDWSTKNKLFDMTAYFESKAN